MSSEKTAQSRRQFLKLTTSGVAAAAIVAVLPRAVRAADLPHVSEADPTAKALSYVEDASTTTNPAHKAGDNCSNCNFYSGGATGYGPCQLFPDKAVSAKGWCVSHISKG